MRGEHVRLTLPNAAKKGSSPHARGALGVCHGMDSEERIIPACAGSTVPYGQQATRQPDHPRMRGEHRARERAHLLLRGSSPHARGAHSPARPAMLAYPDHPRMRGEHATSYIDGGTPRGSSPHARGAHTGSATAIPSTGIIPACAGSTRDDTEN